MKRKNAGRALLHCREVSATCKPNKVGLSPSKRELGQQLKTVTRQKKSARALRAILPYVICDVPAPAHFCCSARAGSLLSCRARLLAPEECLRPPPSRLSRLQAAKGTPVAARHMPAQGSALKGSMQVHDMHPACLTPAPVPQTPTYCTSHTACCPRGIRARQPCL